MFAYCRSRIGQLALTLGCVSALAATSAHAQQPESDAGVADAAPVDAEPAADPAVVDEPVVGEPVVGEPLPEIPEINLEAGADVHTGIRGRIVDAKTGLGIEMAPVLITDQVRTRTAITTTDGAYELHIPPGSYTVRSFYDMYHGARLPNVRVSRGRFSEANLTLDPVDEVEDVEVVAIEVAYRADTTTAAAQDAIRMESSGIGEGMGAQEMSRQGAGDAGSAAKRVVGVTVEGTSLVIRGLGGRYSRVYMNGVPVPSTDPDSPSVDLDLFPTDIIDSMTVSKTFLPDMPADFAGGVLEIATVTFPREFTFELGLSGEYSSQSTLRHRLDYNGGSYDFLGFGESSRALPSAVPRAKFKTGDFADGGEAVGESFRNVWQYRRRSALPNGGIDVTLGDVIDLPGGSRFGYLLTAAYDHKDVRTTGMSRKVASDADGDGRPDTQGVTHYPEVEIGAEEVQLATIGTASLDIGTDHSLTMLSVLNRSASDETGYRRGNDSDGEYQVTTEKWQFHYIARQLWFNQLLGDHRNLAGTRMRLRWNGYYAPTNRDEPDRRNITYAPENDGTGMAPPRWKNQSAQRLFSNLDGQDGGGGLSLRFPLWAEGWGTLGSSIRYTERDFLTRRFAMQKDRSAPPDADTLPPEELFSEEGIGTLTFLRNEQTRPTDSYSAQQTVFTGYAMLETPIIGALSASGGLRAEIYKQRLAVQSPFPPEEGDEPPVSANRTDVNYLPALALKYELSEVMLLRAAYGMTVGRPQARELAPFIFFDFARDRNVVGNLALRTTTIHNLDLRWEWFFDEAQVIAVSAFYKKFNLPIEQYLGSDGSAIFSNTPSAQNVGAEFEFRASLKQVTPALRNFEFGSNLTLVHSRVEIPAALCMSVLCGARRMFGQAPYVINLSLRYSDPVTKASLGAVYNVVGARITDVGFRSGDEILPNVEDQPVHSVDLIGGWEVSEHLKLKLKWKNVLLQSRRLNQGGVQIQRRDPGTFVSLGLDYTY